jgi:hypothetical protein
MIHFTGTVEMLERCAGKERTRELVPHGLKPLKAWVKCISYRHEILSWLSKCHGEIAHIVNLGEAVRLYTETVERVVGQYRSKVISMDNFLVEHPEHLENVFTAKRHVNDMLGSLLYRMLEAMENYLDEKGLVKIEPDSPFYDRYTLSKCKEWFANDIKKRYEYIGFAFKLDERYALRIEAATQALHVGVIEYERKGNTYIAIAMPEKRDPRLSQVKLVYRRWKNGRKCWYSIECGNYVKGNDEKVRQCLRYPLDDVCIVKRHIDTILNLFTCRSDDA